MVTFIKGRVYFVATENHGLVIGEFVKKDGRYFKFKNVRSFDAPDYVSTLRVHVNRLIDAEPWLQTMPVRDYTMTKYINERREELKQVSGRRVG